MTYSGIASAAGGVDASSESLSVQPDHASLFEDEVRGSNPDGSDRKGDDLELPGEGFGGGAVNIEGSESKNIELGSPIDRKMGEVNLTVPSYGTESKEGREVDPLPEYVAVEPDCSPLLEAEVYESNLDSSYWKGGELELAGEEIGAGAVDADDSAPKSLDLRSFIDLKMEKVGLMDPSYPTDSKEDGDGVPMAADAVPLHPEVNGSAQTSKGDGNGEVSLSAESKMMGEDHATDSCEDSVETESEEPESDDDSSSEESSSSSSSEEDEDGDSHDGEEDEKDREEVFVDSDVEEEDVKESIKWKNDIQEIPSVPPVEVTLQPQHQLLPVGAISSILDTKVVVEGWVNHNPLDEGSILWITDTKSPLGFVDEIFGPVKCPYYVIRYNSEKDVPAGISEGTAVSFVMAFVNKILNEKDLYKKGYDASGENDEEDTDEVEFSDDEKEAEYKRSISQEKRGIDDERQGNRQTAWGKKKTKSKGAEPRKGFGTLGSVGMNQLTPGVSGPPASAGASNSAHRRGSCFLGVGNACVSAPPMAPAVPQAMNSGGCPNTISHQFSQWKPNAMCAPPLPQPNAFWPNPMPLPLPLPLQQQPYAIQASGMLPQQQVNAVMRGFQMNGLPNQQLGNHIHQQQQHQIQVSSNMNLMPSQQQFFPLFGTPPNMPWPFRPSNVYAGPMAPWMAAPAGISQAPSGQRNIFVQGSSVPSTEQNYHQISPGIVQAGMPNPFQFNLGSSSVHGTRPNVQGDGHSYGRGGWRRKG